MLIIIYHESQKDVAERLKGLTPLYDSDQSIITNLIDIDTKIKVMRAHQLTLLAFIFILPFAEFGRPLLYRETWEKWRVCPKK